MNILQNTQKVFECTKERNGKLKTFRLTCTLEYMKERIDKNHFINVYIINNNDVIPLYTMMHKDKLLSQYGTHKHIEKYCK